MLRNILIAVFVLVIGIVAYGTYHVMSGYASVTNVPARQIMGNSDGDLTVVEFLDYSCVYCRQAHPTITGAVQQDGQIQYIVRPVAVVSEQSGYAASAVYAADHQGKFKEMHEYFITLEGSLDLEGLQDAVEAMGMDWELFQNDMQSEIVKEALRNNHLVFSQVGANATPTFIIGRKMFYVPQGSMPTTDDFLEMFAEARSRGFK